MWVQIIMAVVQMAMSMKQASDQQKAAQKQAQQQMDAQAKKSWDEYDANEKARKDQLKKALATRRAKMGASGMSSADGSAGAIIQGMRTDEAEASYDDFTTRKEALNDSSFAIQANLLEKSDQSNRKLYSQLGSSVGSIGGSYFGGASGGQTGGELGGQAGSLFS